ncbi:MAG: ArsB/NhaD family transporter, partial [Clostridia bacterium]
ILLLFFSMTVVSVILDEVGFFQYIAQKVVFSVKSSQRKLFVLLYFLVAFLTIFTSNDIIILTFTPFICYFCKNSKISPIPYIVAEFVSANTWSLLLIFGNPTNIYLATSFGIDFASYFATMALPTIAGGIVSFGLLMLIFHKQLTTPISETNQQLLALNKPVVTIGIIGLSVCTVLLAVSSYIHIEMWLISLLCALVVLLATATTLIIQKNRLTIIVRTAKRLPWTLIPFLLSMFVIVISLEQINLTHSLAEFLSRDPTVFAYGFASFLSSNLINNIPMSILFTSMLQTIPTNYNYIYASIVGSNIGAYLTPIGALAGIMWMKILKAKEIDFSFVKFVGYGALISVPTLLVILTVLQVM